MLARDHVRQSQWLRSKFGADVCAKPQPSRRQTADDGMTRNRPKQFTYIVHIYAPELATPAYRLKRPAQAVLPVLKQASNQHIHRTRGH